MNQTKKFGKFEDKTVRYYDSRGFARKGYVHIHDEKNGFVVLRNINGTKEWRLCSDTIIGKIIRA